MRVDAIEIHTGQPDFTYRPVQNLEAKCEATTLYTPAPTIETANAKLRQLAASIGADAVIGVQYNSGVSWTSWKSMKATGLAVKRLADTYACPNCAEQIKLAALQCRFCGTFVEPPRATSSPTPSTAPRQADVLKSNDNKGASTVLIVIAVVVGLIMLFGIANS